MATVAKSANHPRWPTPTCTAQAEADTTRTTLLDVEGPQPRSGAGASRATYDTVSRRWELDIPRRCCDS